MEGCMKEHGIKTKCMVRELIPGQKEEGMKATISKG